MDICLCASKECPEYKNCLRGQEYSRPLEPGEEHRIFTASFLADVCHAGNGFESFIKAREER